MPSTEAAAPVIGSPRRRQALVGGALGRLGESVLAAVLSDPRYQRTTVLTQGPMPATLSGLSALPIDQFLVAPSMSSGPVMQDSDRTILDVYLCANDLDDPMARTPNGRDNIYAPLPDPATILSVATAAEAAGADRLILIAPLAAWQQISMAGRMLPEMSLAGLRIPAIVILRPVTDQASRASNRAETRMQRFARFYLSQLRFMLPAATRSLRSAEIARAALAAMARARPGLTVHTAESLQALLAPNVGPGNAG